MNSFVITTVVVILVLLAGIGLAALIVGFSSQVNRTQSTLNQRKVGANPQLTLGHPLSLSLSPEEQLAEAQRLAAKRAAIQPRGANMRIGRLGAENLLTARQGVADDPVTAVKIARHHGWELFQTEAPWLQPATPEPAGVAAAAPATRSAEDLVPGKDYPFVEISDGMSPEEVRKARVANAKAKSAAIKALKEAGETVAAPAAAAPTAAAAQPAAAAVPPLEFEEIPITDDMSPEEVRRARIANAKAKAAAAKAQKEAGGAVPAAPAPTPEPALPAAPVAAKTDIPANISAPDYIEISDDMDPAELRKARIQNARARSAFHKALKEAGIDPATVE